MSVIQSNPQLADDKSPNIKAVNHARARAGAEDSPYFTIEDLANRWRVSIEAIRGLRKQGKLPPSEPLPLRVVRWHKDAILNYENERRKAAMGGLPQPEAFLPSFPLENKPRNGGQRAESI